MSRAIIKSFKTSELRSFKDINYKQRFEVSCEIIKKDLLQKESQSAILYDILLLNE